MTNHPILKLISKENQTQKIYGVLEEIKEDLQSQPKNQLIEILAKAVSPVEDILGYKFRNKQLLVEALTHESFGTAFKLGFNYERLEHLGDAVLDFAINGNLMRYTIFEKYNI